MSDELSLLLVLLALYLIECVRWLRAPGVAAIGPRGAARLRGPGERFANRKGGLVGIGALETPGAAFAGQPWPISFGDDALCAEVPYAWRRLGRGAASRRIVPYAELTGVRTNGDDILLGGRTLVNCGSDAAARRLAALLSSLADATPARRAAAIEDAVRGRFDRDAIRARIDEVRAARRWPGVTAALLGLSLFGLGPALTHLYGLVAIAAPFGLSLLGLHLIHLTLVFRAHRRLAPEARADRWIEFAKLFLSPPMAIRAGDALSWHRLAEFDPIAVAAVMAHPDDFAAWIAPVRRDLAHPLIAPGLDESARSIVQSERARILAATDALLADMGVEVPDRPATVPDDGGYCPRCLGTYRRVEGECGDCPGVGLRRSAA